MSDEIYYNMLAKLNKLGAPIEGVYEGKSLKEEGPDFLMDSKNKVSEYVEYFGNVANKILIFHADMSKPVDDEFSMLIQDKASRGYYGGNRIYRNTVLPISVLKDNYMKLYRFVEKKCKEMGIGEEDVIIIIMNSGDAVSDTEGTHRDPLFLLHDISHALDISDASLKTRFTDKNTKAMCDLVEESYLDAYEDENGVSLSERGANDVGRYALSEIIFNDDVTKVSDIGNHLFSLSLSKVKGYLKFKDEVYVPSLNETFYKKEEYKGIDMAGAIEDLIYEDMNEKINALQGNVLFMID